VSDGGGDVKGPLVREVGQSFYLMVLVGAVVGAPVGVGLFLARAFA
jgi:hypothetical protein